MKIEVSIGEVVDKITILQIKKEKIMDENKLVHIRKELEILQQTLNKSEIHVPTELVEKLKKINLDLWETEDILRFKESIELYDDEFIKSAVADSVLNDQRFLVKNEINIYCNSNIKEQKSYQGLYNAD